MKRRGLCVGCSYPGRVYGLHGAVPDVFWFATVLKNQYNFDEIVILHDSDPQVKNDKRKRNNNPDTMSTRSNILWYFEKLLRESEAGDVLFFVFSGFSAQVEDEHSYEGEGYHDCLLPTDHGEAVIRGDHEMASVICAEDLYDLAMSTAPGVHLTMVLDCDHMSHILETNNTDGLANGAPSTDPVTGFLNYLGVLPMGHQKLRGVLAHHRKENFQTEEVRKYSGRAKYLQKFSAKLPRIGRHCNRATMSRRGICCFVYAATHFSQTALELKFPDLDRSHGVLTYSFIKALEKVGFANTKITHAQLVVEINEQIEAIKQWIVPGIDQRTQLTTTMPFGNPSRVHVFRSITRGLLEDVISEEVGDSILLDEFISDTESEDSEHALPETARTHVTAKVIQQRKEMPPTSAEPPKKPAGFFNALLGHWMTNEEPKTSLNLEAPRAKDQDWARISMINIDTTANTQQNAAPRSLEPISLRQAPGDTYEYDNPFLPGNAAKLMEERKSQTAPLNPADIPQLATQEEGVHSQMPASELPSSLSGPPSSAISSSQKSGLQIHPAVNYSASMPTPSMPSSAASSMPSRVAMPEGQSGGSSASSAMSNPLNLSGSYNPAMNLGVPQLMSSHPRKGPKLPQYSGLQLGTPTGFNTPGVVATPSARTSAGPKLKLDPPKLQTLYNRGVYQN